MITTRKFIAVIAGLASASCVRAVPPGLTETHFVEINPKTKQQTAGIYDVRHPFDTIHLDIIAVGIEDGVNYPIRYGTTQNKVVYVWFPDAQWPMPQGGMYLRIKPLLSM